MFVGRESELSKLNRSLSQAGSGLSQVVLVKGPAGIGKTSLVREWLAGPPLADCTLLMARCDASEQDYAFGVVSQLLAHAPPAADEQPQSLTEAPQTSPFTAGARLVAQLDEVQDTGTAVVVVDDVQWIDEPSFRALGYLLRRLDADRVLTVLLARSGDPEGQERLDQVRRLVDSNRASRSITLRGLDLGEVERFADDATGQRAGPALARRLLGQTDGSPLYLQTLLNEAPLEQLRRTSTLPVPSTLAQAVLAQLKRLPPPARRLLEAAAVLDAPKPLAHVAHVAGLPESGDALEACLAAGLLRWHPQDPSTPVEVSHNVQQQIVLHAMRPADRRELHAAAAMLVSRSVSWRHRVAAAPGADPGLAAELAAEADVLLRERKAERAATLFLWAADLVVELRDRERLLLTAVVLLLWAERFNRVVPHMDAVRRCHPSPVRDLAIGAFELLRGAVAEGTSHLESALDHSGSDPDRPWVAAQAAYWTGISCIAAGDGERCVTSQRRALELQDVDRTYTMQHRAYLAYGVGMLSGAGAAEQELAHLSALPEAGRVVPEEAFLLSYRGLFRSYAGRLSTGAEDLNTSLTLARIHSVPIWAQDVYLVLALDQYLLGRWDDVSRHVELGDAVSTLESRPWGHAMACAFGSLVPAGRGDWQTAESLLAEGESVAREFTPAYTVPWLTIGRATLAQARGEPQAALDAVEGMFRLPGQGVVTLASALWMPLYIEALIQVDDLKEARRYLTRFQGPMAQSANLQMVSAWLSGLLAQAEDDRETAREHYARGLASAPTPDDMPLIRARLECSYGHLLLRSGEREESRTRLLSAAERFAGLGATPLLRDCERILAEAYPSDEPARRAATGTAALLTAREQDIARLVGQGLSNKEVAAQLYVSTKTVEYHLGHVFTKLQISSRRQLIPRP